MNTDKKNIAVIANEKKFSQMLADNIKLYFGEAVQISSYNMDEVRDRVGLLNEDYVVLSAFTIFQQVKKKVKKSAKIITADLTLKKVGLQKLYSIPNGTKALLVNIDYRNCMEIITMLYELGFKSLDLVPFYPGCKVDENIRLAITPGEPNLVPKEIYRTIDIGGRSIDSNSIYKIASALNIKDALSTTIAKKERDSIINLIPEMDILLGENTNISLQLFTIINQLSQGIMITNNAGSISIINEKANKLMKDRTEILKDFKIIEVFPELKKGTNGLLVDKQEKIVNIGGKNTIVSVSNVESNGHIIGNIVFLEDFNDVEQKQYNHRKTISGYGHKATYSFDKIIGESTEISNTKKIAMRMAKSDSSICLYGDSGTGKELFAQSIHNYSNRRDYAFVAINCSALPENLLESELYGYEEGAFSGARKGGKIGLFELAHKGTLFLDEVEDLPLKMQSKLLRAIEEKKILKVGGKELVDVDVRVVSATNKDLQQMVINGEFRQDLYYRLSVLPIYIPSLRNRGNDIFILLESLKKELNADYQLSKEAIAAMRRYSWPGNVRELKNINEYITNLGKEIIEVEDIPFFAKNVLDEAQSDMIAAIDKKAYVLKILYNNDNKGISMGRQRITKLAADDGVDITEAEVRRILKMLNDDGAIISNNGRKGSTITKHGIDIVIGDKQADNRR